MASSLEQIIADARALPIEECEQLIAGLREADKTPLNNEWAAEIERRVQEPANGAEPYPLEEVLAEIRVEMGQRRA